MKKIALLSVLIAFIAACQSNSPGSNPQQPEPSAPKAAEMGPTLSAEASRGKDIFEANCTVCHAVDQKLIGPALAGVNDRHKPEWLKKFIRNSQKMISEGDPMAVKLFKENNSTVMTSFENLSDEQINDILMYVKESAVKN